MVGAVLARGRRIIAEGWHQRAGEPHAEVNAIRAAQRAGEKIKGATLYVTLEPCSSHGRTPPCTEAILQHGIKRVVVAARDPNPSHAGAGLRLLKRTGVEVLEGLFADEAARLNEVFNHWIVHRIPFVHLKCAMSLDGKIATNSGESKWITGSKARNYGMNLRLGVDAILVGINTVLRDDPALTLRSAHGIKPPPWKQLKRVILDPSARTPLEARVVNDEHASSTVVVCGAEAPKQRIAALENKARVFRAPALGGKAGLELRAVLQYLESEGITSLLVEGGGETHYRFLEQGLVQRVHFLYAPTIVTGRGAAKAVGGPETLNGGRGLKMRNAEWQALGRDLLLTALLD